MVTDRVIFTHRGALAVLLMSRYKRPGVATAVADAILAEGPRTAFERRCAQQAKRLAAPAAKEVR